ncbi:putative protein lunapark-b protein [Erysiphe neolycopersici]|uniref:Endoplasmic reticulum junction formation protein lunapark n=1 Tax=Erysiphe neolycopersici TaxID=212602 RepID=A0A420HQZ4_9PEZI|nr:putative protein lunapark-b protein [Erysiphe neolycopersici]
MMVSLWPWKSEDNSPASFGKRLAALATTISKSEIHLESLRLNLRRYKALWTLYTSFLYLFGLVVLVLVVGWKNWTIWEGTILAGWPVLIYIGRLILNTYYNYRIDTTKQYLEEQQAERIKTIEKLKAATKYNTTHELLERYGEVSSLNISTSPKVKRHVEKKSFKTPVIPPPTANIPRLENSINQEGKPQLSASDQPVYHQASQIQNSGDLTTPGPPEFAPNAFSFSSEYAPSKKNSVEDHWYDRFLDLLLGENEMLPKNRLVLICQYCRLINGQAPPGIKSLESLGNWRCYSCNAMNGEEMKATAEVQRMINDIPSVSSAEFIKEEKMDVELEEVQTSALNKKLAVNEKKIEPKNSLSKG